MVCLTYIQLVYKMRKLTHYTPAPPKVEWGYTGFTRCLSVYLSVCQFAADDILLYEFCHYHPMDLLHHLKKRKEELSPLQYHIKSLQYHIKTLQEKFAKKPNIPWIWRINYGHKLPYMKKTRKKKQVCGAACFMAAEIKFSKDVRLLTTRFPELFKKAIGSIHFIPEFTFMGWVSWPLFIFVFLASFLVLWWPNIWPKMGFLALFEKTIGPIPFIPGIYPYGVSLLTALHFRIPSLIFGLLVAKYLAENGVSGTFWKNYWPNSLHSWHLPLWGESLDPYTFSCS